MSYLDSIFLLLPFLQLPSQLPSPSSLKSFQNFSLLNPHQIPPPAASSSRNVANRSLHWTWSHFLALANATRRAKRHRYHLSPGEVLPPELEDHPDPPPPPE